MSAGVNSSEAIAGRLQRLRDALAVSGQSTILITDLLNVRWLSGFTGSNATMVIDSESATVLTDSRYEIQVALEVPDSIAAVIAGLDSGDRPQDHIASLVRTGKLVFEADNMTVAAHSKLQTDLAEITGSPGAKLDLVPSEGLVSGLRRIKDLGEQEALRRASEIADNALWATLTLVRAGVDERQAARHLENAMAELGSERPSFETIFASGPNAGMPHARPSERVMEKGDLVVIDFGATVEGYGSDMTRTLVVGGRPTEEQQRWYDNVSTAQRAGVALLEPGVDLAELHTHTRETMVKTGQRGVYDHGTGHGVGLFIHEEPIISPRASTAAEQGMALTVEPGAYIPGVGGVRIEDLLLVTATGSEALTGFPKGLAPEPS